MDKRILFAGTYQLQKSEKEKPFGYIQGFAYLPNYTTTIKVFINNGKFEDISEIDGTQVFILDKQEIESLNKGTQFISNSIGILISLSKRNLLKDEFYEDDTQMNQRDV